MGLQCKHWFTSNSKQMTSGRDGKSIDSSQAEQGRFHETGDSEIDGTEAELQKTDTELAEDQAAIDNRQQLTGDALPSIIQFDNLENCIYQCAPGENNITKYILLDDNFEVPIWD